MIRRVTAWVLCLILAIGVFYGPSLYGGVKTYFKEKEAAKKEISIYVPDDMVESFQRAYEMSDSSFQGSHKIIQVKDKEKANIIVDTGKEYDAEYEKLAFSPFIIAYSTEESNMKRFKQTGLLIESSYNNENYEIDFGLVINEVLGSGNWEKFGLNDKGKIHVFYPDPSTEYWNDFYDFMLVTVNGGVYPADDESMKKADEQVQKFINSQYTEAIKDFEEKLDRVGLFAENVFWIIPEKLAMDLTYDNSIGANLFYPTITVYMNYYVKYDEVGRLLTKYYKNEGLAGSFHNYMNGENYRTYEDSVLDDSRDYVHYERNEYNVLTLEKDRIKPNTAEKTTLPAVKEEQTA